MSCISEKIFEDHAVETRPRFDAGADFFSRSPTSLAGKLVMWAARSRQRQALAYLDQRLLRDIGISKAAAENEASKPFWR
jgi:uncharacterized protein YjiS (DUF1127 family)